MMKAVIFDLDGVIVSTDELHFQAWKKLADREGIPFDREINNRLRGVSRTASLDIILEKAEKKYSTRKKEEMADFKNGVYVALLDSLSDKDILEGVSETLAALKRAGVRIAVGSSSKNARKILEKTGLSGVFDAVSDGNNIIRSKPDPEVFLKAAEYLGAEPRDCAVVEDARAGILAAKAAGMTACAVGDAKSCAEADYRIDDIRRLTGIISG